jgi:hypothetical protein
MCLARCCSSCATWGTPTACWPRRLMTGGCRPPTSNSATASSPAWSPRLRRHGRPPPAHHGQRPRHRSHSACLSLPLSLCHSTFMWILPCVPNRPCAHRTHASLPLCVRAGCSWWRPMTVSARCCCRTRWACAVCSTFCRTSSTAAPTSGRRGWTLTCTRCGARAPRAYPVYAHLS